MTKEQRATYAINRVNQLERALEGRQFTIHQLDKHRSLLERLRFRAHLRVIQWARSDEYDPANLPPWVR